MNNAEAKFILQGYRPNGADAGDATFEAALDQAKNDPGLADWFAQQRAFDEAVSAKLAQLPAPADLRAAILAGGRVSENSQKRSWWQQPVWLAAAAGLAVMAATGLVLWPQRAESLTDFALAETRIELMHSGHGRESNTLQAMLNDPSMKLGQALPINFSNLKAGGCRTLGFKGHEVLELCFERKGVWFHAYIARAADFPLVAGNSKPQLEERNGKAMATWTDNEHVIVVVSNTGRKNLEALL